MNTQDAILTLQTASDNCGAEIGKQTQFQSAFNVAIQQLKGLLDTPSVDLVEANNKVTEQTIRAETAEATVATLTATNTDLQNKLSEATGTVTLSPDPAPLSDQPIVL